MVAADPTPCAHALLPLRLKAAEASSQGRRRRGDDAAKSDELAVPIVFDIEDMRAAIEQWGGCEEVIKAWRSLDDSSDVESEVTMRITALPPPALPRDAAGMPIEPSAEEAAKRAAQKQRFDGQVCVGFGWRRWW